MSKPLSTDEVLSLPASIQLETACNALGISQATGYRLVKANAFPCPVVKLGAAIRVPKTGLLRVLGLEATADAITTGA
ncbi:helix-turn-helix domain-containing protein [Paenarthrobacter sp. GOM3]|uniref:helix-turn-helix transcriptional regulator n=1 Tax=Paenarthrobacter sp. GOM3 TaxID=2782567 RepID=UPI001BA78105|nr:helix-turn-helix domain-containing protein [Paenarthrobacter sp. GOM3]WOH17696.1 helix-turn-helix domain-containing protein [Paenarthrobacter sp. GOM3]